jgi:hypothetical protein
MTTFAASVAGPATMPGPSFTKSSVPTRSTLQSATGAEHSTNRPDAHSTLVAGCHDAPMEYGRIVGESTGVAGGRGGGGDVTGRVMDAVSGVVDQIASQPPEILIAIAVAAFIAVVLIRR